MKIARAIMYFSVLLMLGSFLCENSFASDTEEAIIKIQKAYEGIKDMKGSFTQKSVIKDLNKTETYKGDFFIKPPLKLKCIYRGKAGQEMTVNGDTVVIFKKSENQAFRGRFDRTTYGQTPVALLSGFGNIREEFTVTGKGTALILKPKNPMGNVTSLRINISEAEEEFPIRSFVINDSLGNTIEISLSEVKTNSGLKDSLFDLTLPKRVSVFEQ